jgi:Cu(I)/Ag(I) efflux system periplasmic protein CusF
MRLIGPAVAAFAICLASQVAAAQSSLIDGEVMRVDQPASKITLKHGPIKKLQMDEGMTMVFAVKEPAMLNGVKAGDKVRFDAERVNGQFTVTKLEKR